MRRCCLLTTAPLNLEPELELTMSVICVHEPEQAIEAKGKCGNWQEMRYRPIIYLVVQILNPARSLEWAPSGESEVTEEVSAK